MSEAFHIISDGSCDLPMEMTKEKDITVVPFYVSFEEGKYQKEMIEIGVREFYQEMVDHPDVYPKSSMPSVQDYVDAFLPFVKAGTPIICICITTKFSGSMQSALNWRTHRALSIGNRCREESYLKFISPWQAFNNSCTFSKA